MVKLQVWRGSFTCLLLCLLVQSKCCRPILGKSAYEVIVVVEMKDPDAIQQPDPSDGQVSSVLISYPESSGFLVESGYESLLPRSMW